MNIIIRTTEPFQHWVHVYQLGVLGTAAQDFGVFISNTHNSWLNTLQILQVNCKIHVLCYHKSFNTHATFVHLWHDHASLLLYMVRPWPVEVEGCGSKISSQGSTLPLLTLVSLILPPFCVAFAIIYPWFFENQSLPANILSWTCMTLSRFHLLLMLKKIAKKWGFWSQNVWPTLAHDTDRVGSSEG